MTLSERLMTGEEMEKLPRDGRRYELLDGVLHEMAPTNETHDRTRTFVTIVFAEFILPRELGWLMTGDTGYYLRRNPDRLRAPDLSFKSNERLGTGGRSRGYSDVLPDLVVEIVSPGDTAAEVEEKALEWLNGGVRLVLVVYPSTRSVVAYRGPSDLRRYAEGDTLDAEPVLPGFSCPVARLFA
ncbi:MAG: Uma2 family endonuclease [Chloroflexi bacterium]|nr:Uma2 family endonuclease [Chloroflexota bacterium]